MRVTWTRPDVLNGIIVSYTITYETDGPSMSITVDYNGEDVSCLFDDHLLHSSTNTTETIF